MVEKAAHKGLVIGSGDVINCKQVMQLTYVLGVACRYPLAGWLMAQSAAGGWLKAAWPCGDKDLGKSTFTTHNNWLHRLCKLTHEVRPNP